LIKVGSITANNHNKLDNQKHNLRLCTTSQNNMNQIPTRGISKYKGIYWHNRNKKWVAQIKSGNNRIHIGCFENEKDAARAYNEKAIELFGEFAYLNYITEEDDETNT
jgi:hypothetical protein